jgi:hypothetical protein
MEKKITVLKLFVLPCIQSTKVLKKVPVRALGSLGAGNILQITVLNPKQIKVII